MLINLPNDLGVEQVLLIMWFTILCTLSITRLSETGTEPIPIMDEYLECLTNFNGLLLYIFYHTPVYPAFNPHTLHHFRDLLWVLTQGGQNLARIQLQINPDSPFLVDYMRSIYHSRVAFDMLSQTVQAQPEIVNLLIGLQ